MWEYELTPGNWIQLTDEDSEKLTKLFSEHEFQDTRGRVFHCFGDKWSVGVDFKSMTTHCLSAHKDGSHCGINHNSFKLRRK